MRKIIALLMVLLSFAACGSNVKDKENGLENRAFRSKAEMIWQDKIYNCEIERVDSSSLKMTVKGENLQIPICFDISQGGFKMTQGELELSVPFNEAQPQSAAAELYRTFMLLGQAEGEKTGDIITYKISSSVLRYDKKSDEITMVETQNGKITFKDFSFLPEQR